MQPARRKIDVRVCHITRGRIRLRAFRMTEEDAGLLRDRLTRCERLRDVDIRPVTGSIILHYCPIQSDPRELVRSVARELRGFRPSRPGKAVTRSARRGKPARGLSLPGVPFVLQLAILLFVSGFLAFGLIRKLLLRSPLSETPFSVTGIAALISALPLLAHTVRETRVRRGFTIYLFLSGACLLAIFMGEALTAMEILWVTGLSIVLEDYVADRSRRAIRETLQVIVRSAFVLVDGTEVEMPVEKIAKGDIVVVRAGERIPIDGTAVDGEALVDEAYITGRAEPEHRKKGDALFAGTLLQQGLLRIRADRVGEETYLNRMIRLVEESLANRAPAEQRADVLASRLLLLGTVATIGTFLITRQAMKALTVLLISACPCATVMAASTAVSASLANAARHRIFVKGGLYLERFNGADCFCFDKTGTVTRETPQVTAVIGPGGRKGSESILALAATAEFHNPHPLARAIVEEALRAGIELSPDGVSRFILGRGVRTELGRETILVGSGLFMRDSGVDVTRFARAARRLNAEGKTAIYVALNAQARGLLGISNSPRDGMKDVLDWLRTDGVGRLVLVTGDTEQVTRPLGERLGFDRVLPSLLPEDKAGEIERLRSEGRIVVMVGDGINDALALSGADIGVAMGAGGAETALEAADVTLADSDLRKLILLRQVSRQTLRVIEQNHWLAVSTNLVGIVFAIFGNLAPVAGGILHIIHTMGIMLNSSRLLRWEPNPYRPSPDR
ncbi:MAG TPA: heavy metal translocating P-type ATPase [Syntrophales bacterium]|nr:heavy metal translocating P-type ATPase [Syntrophales bacterium]